MKEKILATNARYTSKVEALLNELSAFDNERLNRKPSDGGWSAIQTLHHMVLVEENSLAYIRKKLSFNPQLEKAGLGSWWRSLLLRISLWAPIKFKAPKSAGIELIPDTDTLQNVCARWQKIRGEWGAFFEKMPPELQNKTAYKHPRAGRLSWLHMLDFFSSHFERHRLQVRRAIS